MTPQEVTNDVLARMPKQNRLPELTDHENAEMYKAVCRAVNAREQGRPPAKRVARSDIPKILEDLREQIRDQGQEHNRGQERE